MQNKLYKAILFLSISGISFLSFASPQIRNEVWATEEEDKNESEVVNNDVVVSQPVVDNKEAAEQNKDEKKDNVDVNFKVQEGKIEGIVSENNDNKSIEEKNSNKDKDKEDKTKTNDEQSIDKKNKDENAENQSKDKNDNDTKINSQNVLNLVSKISELLGKPITLEVKADILSIDNSYGTLTYEEQQAIENYQAFVNYKNQFNVLFPAAGLKSGFGEDMAPNVPIGSSFFLSTLKERYKLSFSKDFNQIITDIENEYKQQNNISKEVKLYSKNWQDVIAIYVYNHYLKGENTYNLDGNSKEELKGYFIQLNPIIHDKDDINKIAYGNRNVDYYIQINNIKDEGALLLHKYTSTECKIMCSALTASPKLIRNSANGEISNDRVKVLASAYSILGKVGYFWGGKSQVIGMDPNWGNPSTVSIPGSTSSGSVRPYGLDCSGFVSWSVANGYKNPAMEGTVGTGTSEQWINSTPVSIQDAKAGDLLFQKGPEAGMMNHVGIVCGKEPNGQLIAIHCSSSSNGVTIGDAYGASFRYVRRPSFYNDKIDDFIAPKVYNTNIDIDEKSNSLIKNNKELDVRKKILPRVKSSLDYKEIIKLFK